MPSHRTAILACAVLACGACTNPAPYAELPDAGANPLNVTAAADCGDAPPPAMLAFPPSAPIAEGEPLDACHGAGLTHDAPCESQLSGWYGLAYDLDVLFRDGTDDAQPAYQPGRGRLRLLFKAHVQGACPDAEVATSSTLEPCAVTLPELTTGRQQLQAQARWDDLAAPALTTQFRASDLAGQPKLQHDLLQLSLGITPPLAEGWPAYTDTPRFDCGAQRQGSACFPDADGDGQPGISLQLSAAGAGRGCAAGLASSAEPWADGPRVKTLYLGLHTALQASFAFDPSCETGVGVVSAREVALRVLDCQLDSGAACNALQATFADRHAPLFHVLQAGEVPTTGGPSAGGRVHARRLAPAQGELSCRDVQNAFAHTQQAED